MKWFPVVAVMGSLVALWWFVNHADAAHTAFWGAMVLFWRFETHLAFKEKTP